MGLLCIRLAISTNKLTGGPDGPLAPSGPSRPFSP